MLKRILTLVDETPASKVARGVARDLASQFGAGMTAMGGLDLPLIEEPELVPLGGMAWKRQLVDSQIARARDRRERLKAAYEAECKAHGRPCRWLEFEGDPDAFLLGAAETHDLIVLGRDSSFDGAREVGVGELAAFLIKVTPRPVLVCPDHPPRNMPALVAYDGSPPAMKALQLATLLGLMSGKRRIGLVAVAEREDTAAERGRRACEYLHAHGIDSEQLAIGTDDHPGRQIRAVAERRQPGMLVMGAYGHRGLQEILFGSTTQALLDDMPCPLFIYH